MDQFLGQCEGVIGIGDNIIIHAKEMKYITEDSTSS